MNEIHLDLIEKAFKYFENEYRILKEWVFSVRGIYDESSINPLTLLANELGIFTAADLKSACKNHVPRPIDDWFHCNDIQKKLVVILSYQLIQNINRCQPV